jgi:hypothetical protein
VARAANLRRWASTYLGAGPPPKPGKRPPLDLRPVATAIRFATTDGEFQQRLLFERLMARYVPLSARRDLRPPAWLHLDVDERFPRLATRSGRAARGGGPLFGPFRDARAASRARDALHRRLPLRPCDFAFEPHAELPLGLGCIFAQTRSCAAPCLERVSEDDYRAVARDASRLLRGPREEDADLPPWVSAQHVRALVADPTRRGLGLYPVRHGHVLETAALACSADRLEEAVRALSWPETAGEPDWPWLVSWLHAPRRKGRYLVVDGDSAEALAAHVRRAL